MLGEMTASWTETWKSDIKAAHCFSYPFSRGFMYHRGNGGTSWDPKPILLKPFSYLWWTAAKWPRRTDFSASGLLPLLAYLSLLPFNYRPQSLSLLSFLKSPGALLVLRIPPLTAGCGRYQPPQPFPAHLRALPATKEDIRSNRRLRMVVCWSWCFPSDSQGHRSFHPFDGGHETVPLYKVLSLSTLSVY